GNGPGTGRPGYPLGRLASVCRAGAEGSLGRGRNHPCARFRSGDQPGTVLGAWPSSESAQRPEATAHALLAASHLHRGADRRSDPPDAPPTTPRNRTGLSQRPAAQLRLSAAGAYFPTALRDDLPASGSQPALGPWPYRTTPAGYYPRADRQLDDARLGHAG